MHKAINIKHRVVRRVDIEIAPLATFDTIDLGDEDIEPSKEPLNENDESQDPQNCPSKTASLQCHTPFPCTINSSALLHSSDEDLKTRTIGGNTSKKSLSQAGGEKSQKEPGGDAPPGTSSTGSKHVTSAVEVEPAQGGTSAVTQPQSKSKSPFHSVAKPDAHTVGDDDDNINVVGDDGGSKTPVNETPGPSLQFNRQSSLGRVSLPVRQPDSDSSSSSSESFSENTCTFQESKSPATLTGPEALSRGNGQHREDTELDRLDNLVPDNIDPSQILSPSKRKAYERRIERLKVTTSPIARPRSTTPISVVTLDEYAAISSPDASPASPSVLQDKLKITLPLDEFAAKPKAPKHHSGKRRSSEDTIFQFSEENLFSRSKSTLLVEDDGQLPLSPRRVLIPPTLTPSSSPKLSRTPLSSKSPGPESIPPTLSFSQQKATTHKFFGETVDETEEENWASFPEPSPTIEAPLSALVPGLSEVNTAEASKLTEDECSELGNAVTDPCHEENNAKANQTASTPLDTSDNLDISSRDILTITAVDNQTSESSNKSIVTSSIIQSAFTQEEIDFFCERTDPDPDSVAPSQDTLQRDKCFALLTSDVGKPTSETATGSLDKSEPSKAEARTAYNISVQDFELDGATGPQSHEPSEPQKTFQTDLKEQAIFSNIIVEDDVYVEPVLKTDDSSLLPLSENAALSVPLDKGCVDGALSQYSDFKLGHDFQAEDSVSIPSSSICGDLSQQTALPEAAVHSVDTVPESCLEENPNLPPVPSRHLLNTATSVQSSTRGPLTSSTPTRAAHNEPTQPCSDTKPAVETEPSSGPAWTQDLSLSGWEDPDKQPPCAVSDSNPFSVLDSNPDHQTIPASLDSVPHLDSQNPVQTDSLISCPSRGVDETPLHLATEAAADLQASALASLSSNTNPSAGSLDSAAVSDIPVESEDPVDISASLSKPML